jgi:endonuclease-3
MAAGANKQAVIDKALAAFKKKYPAPADPDRRAVLEEVVFGILREGVPTAVALPAYQRLKEDFFDWNEVRVSSVQEVADVLVDLPDSGTRALHIVKFLQEHFERTYSFELDDLEKKGVKQASKQLARYKDKGVSDFVVAWATQRALGGHAIPLDTPTIRVLSRLGVLEGVADGEIEDLEAVRTGLEHYISKAKMIEFTEGVIQLADELCVERAPKCGQCPLKADCPTGHDHGSKGAKPKSDKPKGK